MKTATYWRVPSFHDVLIRVLYLMTTVLFFSKQGFGHCTNMNGSTTNLHTTMDCIEIESEKFSCEVTKC